MFVIVGRETVLLIKKIGVTLTTLFSYGVNYTGNLIKFFLSTLVEKFALRGRLRLSLLHKSAATLVPVPMHYDAEELMNEKRELYLTGTIPKVL